MSSLKVLLNSVELLGDKHKAENKSKASSFNIFSLLRKSSDEVNLHSKFIHELLDVHGTHGQGKLFLELFLKTLGLEIDSYELLAYREKYNIDILLKSSSDVIIIENKIYTDDHSSQLSRYYETITHQGYSHENIKVVYLTLFGHIPTEKLDFEVINISYRKEIFQWLEASMKEVQNIPTLYVPLEQYLSLVKELSHKSTEKGFVMDVKRLLLEDKNLQTIINMEASVIEAKIEIQFSFWQTLLANLIPHHAFTFYNANNDKGLRESICRYYQQQKNIKDYGVEYEVEDNLYFFIELRENIYYGFYFLDEDLITESEQEVMEVLGHQWDEVSSTIYWKYPEKPLNFKDFNHQNIFDLIDEELREKHIGEISNEILTFIENYKRNIKC